MPLGCNRRFVIIDGLFHALVFCKAFVNGCVIIVNTITDYWPAIIQGRLDDVDLVSTFRSVFMFPKFSGERIYGKPVRITKPITPDFWFSVSGTNVWVI